MSHLNPSIHRTRKEISACQKMKSLIEIMLMFQMTLRNHAFNDHLEKAHRLFNAT